MLDRRAFLRRLGFGTVGAAAAAIVGVDIERLLWLPNEKTIIVPTVTFITQTSVISGELITPMWVTKECVQMFQKQICIVSQFNRRWDERFV